MKSFKQSCQKGFNLIELMIVVAIIGIISSIALPAYSDYTVRTQVAEGLSLAAAARTGVSEAFTVRGMPGISAFSTNWNAEFSPTKYVSAITIDGATGRLAIVYDVLPGGIPQLGSRDILLMTPSINISGTYTQLSSSVSGVIDWSCASSTRTTASSRGMLVLDAGVIPRLVDRRYAPGECQ